MKSTPVIVEDLQTYNQYIWLGALALISALAAGLIYGSLTTGHNWGDDFAGYIGQAKSILEDNVDDYIEQNALTMQNSNQQIGPVVYPWGYPLLLTGMFSACGLNIFCLKLLNIPIYLSFLIILFFLLNRYLTKTESLLIVALFAVNPNILGFQDNILSDIPFMLFSTLAIWFVDRALLDEHYEHSWIFKIMLGVTLFLAFSVRTPGILIVVTLFTIQSFQIALHFLKTKKFLISPQMLTPYVVFSALYLILSAVLPSANATYLAELHISWKGILYNLWYYQSRFFYFFGNLPSFSPLSWILWGLALTGMILTIQRNYIFVVYTLATLGLYIIWPFPTSRFLFGIFPFIVYFVYYPIRYVLDRLLKFHTVWRVILTSTLLITSSMYFGWQAVTIVRNNILNDRVLANGPFTPQSAELFAFILEQTPSDGKIIFFKPRILSLLTGRSSWIFNRCDSLDGGDFVVVMKDEKYKNSDPNTIKSCNSEINFEPVFENDAFIVYKENY